MRNFERPRGFFFSALQFWLGTLLSSFVVGKRPLAGHVWSNAGQPEPAPVISSRPARLCGKILLAHGFGNAHQFFRSGRQTRFFKSRNERQHNQNSEHQADQLHQVKQTDTGRSGFQA